jgi:5'-nucleotidase
LRGIALSTPSGDGEPDFGILGPWVAVVLEVLLKMPELTLVNVNLPSGMPRGIRWTAQAVSHYDGRVVKGEDPMKRLVYWYTVVPIEGSEEGTDRWAVEQGYVSVSPLRLDLTDHERLAAARASDAMGAVKFG